MVIQTQLSNIGSITDLEAIKEFLFREEEIKSSWFDEIQFSLSPSCGLGAFQYKGRLVVIKEIPPDVSPPNELSYRSVHKGYLNVSEEDHPTAVLCLSIAIQHKSVGSTLSLSSSLWDCIIVGYSSGYIRMYTEVGALLFEQIFHPQPILQLKYCHPKVLQDELMVIHPDVIIAVDGFSLYQCLRICRMQMTRSGLTDQAKNTSLSYKKLQFQDQKGTADVEFFGVRNTTPFEHLFQASLAGGSAHYIGQAGLGPVYNYLAVGKEPFVAQYCPSEQVAQLIMSEVVMNVASKLLSYVPGSSWLKGWTEDPKAQHFEPAISVSKNICIDDPRREIISMRASPKGSLAILSDKFGRLLLLCVDTMTIINIWKGYRDAQCGWMLVPEPGIVTGKPRNALFMVVYAKRRGILEIWCPYQHFRVSAFNVGKQSTLVNNMFSALGEGSLSSPLIMPRWRINKSTCLLIDGSGAIIDIQVPFESCLGQEHSEHVEDKRLLEEFTKTISELTENASAETELLLEEILEDLKLPDSLYTAMDSVFSSPLISPKLKHEASLSLISSISMDKDQQRDPAFIKLYHLCTGNTKLMTLHENIRNSWRDVSTLSSSSCSPLVDEFQTNINKYFATYHTDAGMSLENPYTDLTQFGAEFKIVGSQHSINEATCLNPNPNKVLSQFIMLPLLFSKDWAVHFDRICAAHISFENMFDLFLEACLSLDISIISRQFEMKISQIIEIFLRKYPSHELVWDHFFTRLENHPNICQAFILAIYGQRIAVATPEFTSLNVDTDEGVEQWETLSPEHEKWYTLRQRLSDTLELLLNASTYPEDITVRSLLQSNSDTVTHIVSRTLIEKGLVQNFIDWVERCKNAEDEDDDDNDVFDDELNWLLNIIPLWPYQLDPTSISVCLVECLVDKWDQSLTELSEDPSAEVSVKSLISAIQIVLSVKSAPLQQCLLSVLWNKVFCQRIKKIYLVLEKVGRQPKDRVCQKDIGLSLDVIMQFISAARYLLNNVSLSDDKEDVSVYKQENVWRWDERRWLINDCISPPLPVNCKLVVFQAELVNAIELCFSLNLRGCRPSSIFHTAYHHAFFLPLTSEPDIKLLGSPEIDRARVEMLKLAVKEAYTCTIPLLNSTWHLLITSLATSWNCTLVIHTHTVVYLYAIGLFDKADEIISSSSHRANLGISLLEILLSQLEKGIYRNEESQKLYLPLISPSLSMWLKSKHNVNVAQVDIGTVYRIFCKVLSWVRSEESAQTLKFAMELRLALSSML